MNYAYKTRLVTISFFSSYSHSENVIISYPATEKKFKIRAVSALVHIHNAQTRGTHYKSIVKPVYLREMAAPLGNLIPQPKKKFKIRAVSALVHIHNAQTRGTHYKSIVKPVYLREMAAPLGNS